MFSRLVSIFAGSLNLHGQKDSSGGGMSHIVMPNGRTMAEDALPFVREAYSTGTLDRLLGLQPGHFMVRLPLRDHGLRS